MLTDEPEIELTETDKDFESFRPGYYIFERNLAKPWDQGEGRCLTCGKKFRTHLRLLRFCSRACQAEMIERLSTLAQAPEPRPLEERVKPTKGPVISPAEVVEMCAKEGLTLTTGSAIVNKPVNTEASPLTQKEKRRAAARECMRKKRAAEKAAKSTVKCNAEKEKDKE